jgi:hypothetical protein
VRENWFSDPRSIFCFLFQGPFGPINRGKRPACTAGCYSKVNSSHRETAISSSYRPGFSRISQRASSRVTNGWIFDSDGFGVVC